jgi:hypothetical protein
MAAGLTPALKAARTALSLPVVNEAAPPAAALRGGDLVSGADGRLCETGIGRPRRLASAVIATSRESTSASASRSSAPAKSLGKRYLGRAAGSPGAASPRAMVGCFGALALVEADAKRSGVGFAGRFRVGMALTMQPAPCRGQPALAGRSAAEPRPEGCCLASLRST